MKPASMMNLTSVLVKPWFYMLTYNYVYVNFNVNLTPMGAKLTLKHTLTISYVCMYTCYNYV